MKDNITKEDILYITFEVDKELGMAEGVDFGVPKQILEFFELTEEEYREYREKVLSTTDNT